MREFLLALGIFLGVVPAQPAPELAVRVLRTVDYLLINAEVQNALGPEVQNYLESGNTLSLGLQSNSGGAEATSAVHIIRYDPITQTYNLELGETGTVHTSKSPAAAFLLFSSFYRVPVRSVDDLDFPLSLRIEARLSNPDRPLDDVQSLWNGKKLRSTFKFESLEKISW